MSGLRAMGRVLGSAGGPLTAAALSGVYLYTRLQSPDPLGLESSATVPAAAPRGPRALLSRLATGSLARRQFRYRMRDGSRIRCRLLDSGGPLSVHVDRDYEVPGVDWRSTRTILDIGAHVGSFTLWAANRAPSARILAVEPNPESFRMLSRNIRENGLADRVTAVHAAVGPQSGTAQLEFLDHSLGTRVASTGAGEFSVRMETVENLLAEANMDTVDFFKIDCEGMEYVVFEGIDPDRLRSTSTLACEYHPVPGRDVQTIDALLASAGFRVSRPDQPLGVLWATR